MGMFKAKSELIPVTARDSHSSKNENLGSELCRTILAEPFYFWGFFIHIKMTNRKQLLTSAVCSSQNRVVLAPEEGVPKR